MKFRDAAGLKSDRIGKQGMVGLEQSLVQLQKIAGFTQPNCFLLNILRFARVYGFMLDFVSG